MYDGYNSAKTGVTNGALNSVAYSQKATAATIEKVVEISDYAAVQARAAGSAVYASSA